MAEDSWLECERQWFVEKNAKELGILAKTLNKAIEKYNRYLQKALLGDSPFVAEDLRKQIAKQGDVLESKC